MGSLYFKNVTDRVNDRSLHDAARRGTIAEVQNWLNVGADVDTQHPGGIAGSTPLHEAAGRGDLAMVKLLIAKGAKLDLADDQGHTALFRAGTEEVVELLLEKGAKAELKNAEGETVMQWAQRKGFGWKAEVLERAKAGQR
jgi:ankyrin repeat protein